MSAENIKTTTTTTEAITTTAAPARLPYQPMPSELVQVTVADLLDLDVAVPGYQRGYEWRKAQEDLLADSLRRGVPMPPVIVARIYKPDGTAVLLLIDGLQRTTALRNITEGCGTSPEGAALMEQIYECPVWVLYIDCADADEAATLFVRYNNGSPLSGVQRQKAALPASKLAIVAPYTEALRRFDFVKLGKVTPDVAAVMLAGAAVAMTDEGAKDKASTSGASASKLVASAATVPELERMPGFAAAIEAIASLEDKATRAIWATPARLVPLCMAAEKARATAEEVGAMLEAFSPESGKLATVVHKGKPSEVSVSEAFSDRSNAAKATAARRDVLLAALTGKLFSKGGKGKAAKTTAAEQAAQAATAAAIRGMLEG